MTSPARTKYNVGISLLLLCILGGFIVFYRFVQIPKTLTFDEIEFAKLALSLAKQPYTPYSPLATGHSTLYFYVLLLSLRVFGITSFGLRIPSAVSGFISVLVAFFVFRKSIRKMEISHSNQLSLLLPFVASFLFITTRWYFNFARFGFEATFLMMLELTSLFFFLHYIDHRQHKWLIPSGICTGLAFNSYQPGRIFFILPLIFIFLNILERKQNRLDFSFFSKSTIATFLSFVVPFIILITPLSLYLMQNKDVRINQLMYPSNNELSADTKLQYLTQNIVSTSLMFSVKGDVNGRHNYPNKAALNPIISLLFLSGFCIAVWKIKNKMNQLFLIYFFIAIFPTLLTYPWENPNMLRTITCIPAIVYFSILSLAKTHEMLEKKCKIRHSIIIVGIFIIISLSALYDLRTYYIFQAPVFVQAFEAHMPLSYYIDHPDATIKK